MTHTSIKVILTEWLRTHNLCLPGDIGSLWEGPVFGSGLLDSLGLLRLILFVEERFEIAIPDVDLVPEKFDTMDVLVDYIAGRLDEIGTDGTSADSPS